MRKLILAFGLMSGTVLLLGCPKKNAGDADAASDAAVAADDAAAAAVTDAAAAPVAVTAKNTADVARFPAEVPVPDDDAKLAQASPARTSPNTGAVVATIPPSADVTKIAEYQNCILVTFADPKDASSTLMGWIAKTAFNAPTYIKTDAGVRLDAGVVVDAAAPTPVADAGPVKITCAAGQAAVILSGTDPVCRKRCVKDAECGGAAGSCANAKSASGGIARVCPN